MDPNANRAEQLKIAAEIQAIQDSADDQGEITEEQLDRQSELAVRLAELVAALDTWITGGGFLPDAWTAHTPEPAPNMVCHACGFTGDDVQDFVSTDEPGARTCPKCSSPECFTQ